MLTLETFGHELSRLTSNQASGLLKANERTASRPSIGQMRMSSINMDGKVLLEGSPRQEDDDISNEDNVEVEYIDESPHDRSIERKRGTQTK